MEYDKTEIENFMSSLMNDKYDNDNEVEDLIFEKVSKVARLKELDDDFLIIKFSIHFQCNSSSSR